MSDDCCANTDALERRTLLVLLGINAVMFVVELTAGILGESSGLKADALDMLADTLVYGIALYAVGRAYLFKHRAARISGLLQITLGVGVIIEVIYRYFSGSDPASLLMISAGGLALIANTTCFMIINKHKNAGVHMRASWIFSKNDVIANLGVILSGVLVMVLDSRLPDLIIGTLISIIVIRGGVQILREV